MQKQTILQVVDSMPDEVDVDLLLNKLYVLDKIEAGERALAEQGGITQEEVQRRYCR